MSAYLSRFFSGTPVAASPSDQSTPTPASTHTATPTSKSKPQLAEVEVDSQLEADLPSPSSPKRHAHPSTSSQPGPSALTQNRSDIQMSINSDGVPQFTVLTISNLLAQNSNLLAQNLEMSRQVEKLREADMERIKSELKQELGRELKEELRKEVLEMVGKAVREIVGTLGELQPTPRATPNAADAGALFPDTTSPAHTDKLPVGANVHGINNGNDSQEFRDMVLDQIEMEGGELDFVPNTQEDHQENQDHMNRFWNSHQSSFKGKGKAKEVIAQERGVDPNDLHIRPSSFTALYAPDEVDHGDEERDGGGWDHDMADGDGTAMAGSSSQVYLTNE